MAPFLNYNDIDYEFNYDNHEQLFEQQGDDKPSNGLNGIPGYGPAHGKQLGKQLVQDALAKRVEGVNQETCDPGDEDTFFVADLGEVYRQHLRWKMNLSMVKPHYGKS